MRKILLILLFFPFAAKAQTPLDVCIDSIYAAYIHNLPSPTPSQIASTLALATKQCNAIAGYVGSAGGGTMTSLTPGVGFTSHTPITTAGTINIDTAGLIASKAWANNTFITSYTETDPLSFHKADSNTAANAITLTYYNAHLPSVTGYIPYTDTSTKIVTVTQLKDTATAIRSAIPSLTGYVPYTGAAHDLQLGNHVLTANSGTYNTEVGTDLFGVENNAVTKYSVLTVDGLTVNSTVPATTMTVTDSGLIFPNGGVQTYKADSVTYVTPYYYTSHLPSLTGYVPTSTILGINGVNYDLSTNRSWSVGTLVGSDTVSLSNRINLKVNYTDTGSMLTPYLRKYDTASLSNRINARVKYTDTSTMLSPYLRNDSTIYVTPTRLADTADTLRAYTDNQIAAAQAGYVNYYFDTSHNGTYRTLTPNYNYATQTTSYTSVVNNQKLDSFVTASLVPSQYTLRAGYYNFHIHATQTSGTKTTELYFALYTMDTTGVKTLQGTSGYTTALTNSDNGYTSDIYILNDVLINLKDRFVVKVIASVTGGGSAPNITLKVMDNTVAGMYAPSQGVSSARYIPWTDTLSSSRYVVTPTYLGSLGYGTGTVTSVGSGYGTNFTAITGTGSVVVDSIAQSTRAWRQKAVDSLNSVIATKGSGTVTSVGSGYGTTFSTITATGNVTVDTAAMATRARVQKGIDSVNAIVATKGSGTVTSVTGGRGLTGGTGTTTWTGGLDTTLGYTWTGSQTLSLNSLGTSASPMLSMVNATSATSVNTIQVSPSLDLIGQYWDGSVTRTSTIRIFNNTNSSTGGEFSIWGKTTGSFSRLFYVSGNGFVTMGSTTLTSLTASGGLTIAGSILANGGITIGSSKKITLNTGANSSAGNTTLSSGTVTISNNLVTLNSQIWVSYRSNGTLSGASLTRLFRVSTIVANTSFTIVAESAPGTTNTLDNSDIQWWYDN